jgi:hypothetical protein
MAALVAGAIAMFMPRYSYFAALAVLVLQLAAMYARLRGQQKQGVGDEIRRRGLLLDALGQFDQSYDLTELFRNVDDDVRTRAVTRLAPDYFASSASVGLVRLRDHLRENAFWNRCLYYEAAQRGVKFLVGILAFWILIIFLAVALVPQGVTVNLIRAFIVFMTFLVAYALFSDVLAWRFASRIIESLDRRLDAIKELSEQDLRSAALGDVLVIFGEYTVATSKTAPIPESVYRRHRARLNKLWSERESGIRKPLR